MRERARIRGSTVFLLELTFSILFFAVASAVCVQLFVQAHLLSGHARSQNLATGTGAGITETLYAAPDWQALPGLLTAAYPEIALPQSDDAALRGELWLDGDFRPLPDKDGAAYRLTVNAAREDTLLRADIVVSDIAGGEELYRQPVVHHLQRGNGT